MKMMTPVLICENFFKSAKSLRKHFEKRQAPGNTLDAERFCWDLFYVPRQYNHLKTPAYHFFPAAIYQAFHSQLVQWGRAHLGCHDISPPWLSLYTDSHFQNWHRDVPHGPWAFVYSLTLDPSAFTGGRTVLAGPELLNYWSNYAATALSGGQQTHEANVFFDEISPVFNQLLVFDPRIPHSVSPVRGVNDPLAGRLVIHGWFVQPRPYVVGALLPSDIKATLAKLIKSANELFQSQLISGTLSLRLKVSAMGRVTDVNVLTNTLVNHDEMNGFGQEAVSDAKTRQSSRLERIVENFVHRCWDVKFSKKNRSSQITLPIIFEIG